MGATFNDDGIVLMNDLQFSEISALAKTGSICASSGVRSMFVKVVSPFTNDASEIAVSAVM